MARHDPRNLSPTIEDIERMANEAFATIPEELRNHVANVVFRVEDFPDEATEKQMGLESLFDLLGLYVDIAMPHHTTGLARQGNDMISLDRRPLLLTWCETGNSLFDI